MPEFARRMSTMARSAEIIGGLYGTMNDPEIISFGGGCPAQEALPIEELQEIASQVFARDKRGVEAFQYGGIQGLKALREVIIENLLAPNGVNANPDQVLITAGGIETMNLVCQLYISPGDVILVEAPTFVQCVEVFEMFEAKCVSCVMDDHGLVVEDVEEKIKKYNPKIVYVIPTFQNPTGLTLSLERRKRLAELGSKYDVIILEDDPYRDIRFSGTHLPPIKSFDKTGHTIFAGSMSKIFSPGSRLGYTVADESIMKHLVNAKSATNSHTSMISQVLCQEFFHRGHFPQHLAELRETHKERREVMVECLKTMFPANTKHTFPDGGLFIWVELPESINTTELLKEATEKYKVSYIAGEGFFTDGGGKGRNCMRLSFSGVKPEIIRVGMERLGKLVSSKCAGLESASS